jgi:hypothetical protein
MALNRLLSDPFKLSFAKGTIAMRASDAVSIRSTHLLDDIPKKNRTSTVRTPKDITPSGVLYGSIGTSGTVKPLHR